MNKAQFEAKYDPLRTALRVIQNDTVIDELQTVTGNQLRRWYSRSKAQRLRVVLKVLKITQDNLDDYNP